MFKQVQPYILSVIFFCLSYNTAVSQSFTLSNPLNISREDEIVSIPALNIADLIKKHGIEKISVRQQKQQQYLLTQPLDTDMDGDYDEILFQTSIGPNETLTYIVEAVKDLSLKPVSKLSTFSRFVPERSNDYAWENDRIAFRVYGGQSAQNPTRKSPGGSMDAFLKRVSYPVINKWYKNNAEKEGAYHIDTGEGHDPYQVGDSRGLGGTGIWDKDSMYVSSNFLSSKTIAVGPLRTIFELTFAPWDANGRTITETKRISLDLGSHLTRIEEHLKSDHSVPNLVAGITLHDQRGEVKGNRQEGWFRYWEPMDDSWLGSAIVMDPAVISDFKDYRTTAKDQSHLFVFGKPVDNKITFYAGYAWQKSGHYKTAAEWENYLSAFTKKLSSPLIPKFRK
jgi:hypothetical protein